MAGEAGRPYPTCSESSSNWSGAAGHSLMPLMTLTPDNVTVFASVLGSVAP